MYPIHFISLGPGEPELITVKGLKLLQQADVIYCPATQSRQGEPISRAANVVRSLGIEDKHIQPFMLPMQRERTAAQKAYDQLYADAVACRMENRRVVIVAEGDAGFYSSIQYIYDKMVASGIEVKKVAGIPAFIAAGALAGLHIVKQEEKIIVIPGTASMEELSMKIEEGYVIVIMKLSACVEAVHACIRKHPDKHFHYFENIGTDHEYYTSDPDILVHKSFPYFSLMIIQGE